MNTGLVSGGTTEHAERTFDKVGKAALFAAFATAAASFDREHWRIAREHAVDERRTVVRQYRSLIPALLMEPESDRASHINEP